MESLSISLIVPTLNCREQLERHLDVLDEWLPVAGEIIAVDSHSSDGTADVLRKRLAKFGARILMEEEGLYRCWNKGISLARYPYTYISTIGDTIDAAGIRELLDRTEQDDLDVMISAPQIVDPQGRNMEGHWPIHHIAASLPSGEETWLPSFQQLLHLSAAFAPGSILGSSASNLYRTSFLQQRPFPENAGHIGDMLWGIMNLPAARVGITGRTLASFCWDGHRDKSREQQIHEQQLILDTLTEAAEEMRNSTWITSAIQCSQEEKLDLLCEIRELSREVTELRQLSSMLLSVKITRFEAVQKILKLAVQSFLKTLHKKK